MTDNLTVTPGAGATIAADDVGGVLYEIVKLAVGADGIAALVSNTNPVPMSDAGGSLTVDGTVTVANSPDVSALATQATAAAILAKLTSDPSTAAKQDTAAAKQDTANTALANILAKLIAAPATEANQATGNASLASILAKLIAAPSTEAKQDTANTSLAAILAKLIAAPSTEAKQDTGNTALSAIQTTVGATSAPAAGTLAKLLTDGNTARATAANQATANTSLAAIAASTDQLMDALASPAVPLGYQQASLTTVQALPSVPAGTTKVLIVPAAAIRWRDDGTNPTTSVGMPIAANQPFEYDGTISAFRMVATSGTVVVDITYYGEPA